LTIGRPGGSAPPAPLLFPGGGTIMVPPCPAKTRPRPCASS
jgi:hypothetical protein